ncbi:MAG: hypothetical protein A2542_02755 [Parcubacteria group bacterium RIFOXYD2_FULL_52_8]|nr:MAG: hypothetical protein A2542_02755 [Parcubacteria group bacterium RIFOXYD2_FULL_52_8]
MKIITAFFVFFMGLGVFVGATPLASAMCVAGALYCNDTPGYYSPYYSQYPSSYINQSYGGQYGAQQSLGYSQPYYYNSYPQYSSYTQPQYNYYGSSSQQQQQNRPTVSVPPFEWHAYGNLPWATSPQQYTGGLATPYSQYGSSYQQNQPVVPVPTFEWHAAGNLPWYIYGNQATSNTGQYGYNSYGANAGTSVFRSNYTGYGYDVCRTGMICW